MSWLYLAARLLHTDRKFDRDYRLKLLSGPSRFLLIRLILHMKGQTMALLQSELTEKMWLSEKVVSTGISELVGIGLLVEQGRVSQGKGRPQTSYRLSQKFLASLESIEALPGTRTFEGIIESLFTEEFAVKGQNNRKIRTRMSPQNRLLLAGMFARSDEYGVLQAVSVADLTRVAGLSKDQFVSQMSKLGELGYVRRQVPGLSASTMFGKVKGWIYLNVMHPDFAPMGQNHWTLVSTTVRGDPPRDVWSLFDDSQRFFRSPRLFESLPLSWPPQEAEPLTRHWWAELEEYHQRWGWGRFSQLWGSEADQSSPALYRYMVDRRHQLAHLVHAHVCYRASKLVTGLKASGNLAEVQRELDEILISPEFGERTYWERALAVKGEAPGQALVSAMMTLVCEMAMRAFAELIRVDASFFDGRNDPFELAILPSPVPASGKGPQKHLNARYSFAVMVFPSDGEDGHVGECLILEDTPKARKAGRTYVVRTLESEWHLEKAERRAFGLELTPKEYPKKQPKDVKAEPGSA